MSEKVKLSCIYCAVMRVMRRTDANKIKKSRHVYSRKGDKNNWFNPKLL